MSDDESTSRPTVYFDHGASSYPKPQPVLESILRALRDLGGNPGRGAYHLAVETSRAIFAARMSCANVLGVADTHDLAFMPGCTAGCNLMLKGVLRVGDRVVTTSMEHNAVARPLSLLRERGVEVVVVKADPAGRVDPADIRREVSAATTRAVVCQHASNVSGAIQPIEEITRVAHEHGAYMLVDGAQAAGHLPVDIGALGVDAYAVSGHKGLLGPQGIGALYLAPGLDAEELVEGGTGSQSESVAMPRHRPARYEAGTPNTPGIVGLGAACDLVAVEGESQRELEARLVDRLHRGILDIGGFRVVGPGPGEPRVPILAVTHDDVEPGTIARRLDQEYGIACRAGLHCAPWGHETMGTKDSGAVRFGIGWGNTLEQVDVLIGALATIGRG